MSASVCAAARGFGRGGPGRGMPGTVQGRAAGGAGALMLDMRGALHGHMRPVRGGLRGLARLLQKFRKRMG